MSDRNVEGQDGIGLGPFQGLGYYNNKRKPTLALGDWEGYKHTLIIRLLFRLAKTPIYAQAFQVEFLC